MPYRILVVDDDADLSETIVRLLRRYGYTCLTAASGSEGIELITTEVPTLVVTDLHMSGIDGLAVARWARDRIPPIPVILMTAYPTRAAHALAWIPDGTLYLSKPFATADFLRAVQDALGRT